MNEKLMTMMERLKDVRSKQVIFVSHCVLNENTRYWGGACRKGCIDEVVDAIQEKGIGIIQMRCPGEVANGILRQRMLVAIGSYGSALYPFIKLVLPLVEWKTKRIFQKMAKEVARQMREYSDIGFQITGILAISGSPFCSVTEKVDFKKSFEFASRIDFTNLNRGSFNEGMSTTWVKGEAWFISALKKEMHKKKVEVPFFELDLRLEKSGGIYDFNGLKQV